jgi:hypothetical protein
MELSGAAHLHPQQPGLHPERRAFPIRRKDQHGRVDGDQVVSKRFVKEATNAVDAAWITSRPRSIPNTHRLPVRAEVENPDGALKPEMFANFSINFRKGKTVANEAKRPSRMFQPITPSNEVVSAQTVERYWVLSQRYLCSPYLTPRITRSRATWEAFCSSAMRSLATRQALWA